MGLLSFYRMFLAAGWKITCCFGSPETTATVDDHDDDDGDEGAEGDDDGEQHDGWPGDYKNFDNESSADLAD